jgi:hypothetical protein
MIVWISSYPKSGNTWIRTFISTYYLSSNDKFDFKMLKNIRQFPHEKFFNKKINDINSAITNWDSAQDNINQKNKLIFLKTHAALVKINNIPFTTNKNTLGAIYVVRDPRNVVTSLSNHYQLTFDESLEFMTNKKKFLLKKNDPSNFGNFTFLNSWSEHYKSWLYTKQFNLLFIKYEDLENDTFNTFKKIVKFLNKIMKKKEKIDAKRIIKIIDAVSFETLKKKENDEGFPEAVINNKKQKINFFYLGKKNKWKNLLSPKQINALNNIFNDDLKKLGY